MTHPSLQGLVFRVLNLCSKLGIDLWIRKKEICYLRGQRMHMGSFLFLSHELRLQIICYIGHWSIIFLTSFSDLGLHSGAIALNAMHVFVDV
jgi:hypothetical protein